jgi:Helix-turn-helix domain/RodZ C-terminal domain
VSIGEDLAEARRRSGLTITQVSQQTRIRESIIRDIEQGDFTACGGDFYARGHIRSIAGVIGTDPAPLISEYDADHGPLNPLRAAEVFEPSRPIKIRERRSPSMTMIVVVVLLAIIGYAAYRLVSSHDKPGHLAGAGATASTSSQPSTRPSATATASPTPSVTTTNVVIKVAATEECWVLLTRTSDGSQIFMGVVPAGNSMTWTEKQGVSIRLGNPGGVVLTVDGQVQPIKTALPVTLSYTPQGGPTPAAQSSTSSGIQPVSQPSSSSSAQVSSSASPHPRSSANR